VRRRSTRILFSDCLDEQLGIRNKAELTRLQRQFDSCVAEVVALEQSKTTGAMIAALSIGIAGTAFMAGSIFAYLADMLLFCIILGFLPHVITAIDKKQLSSNVRSFV